MWSRVSLGLGEGDNDVGLGASRTASERSVIDDAQLQIEQEAPILHAEQRLLVQNNWKRRLHGGGFDGRHGGAQEPGCI